MNMRKKTKILAIACIVVIGFVLIGFYFLKFHDFLNRKIASLGQQAPSHPCEAELIYRVASEGQEEAGTIMRTGLPLSTKMQLHLSKKPLAVQNSGAFYQYKFSDVKVNGFSAEDNKTVENSLEKISLWAAYDVSGIAKSFFTDPSSLSLSSLSPAQSRMQLNFAKPVILGFQVAIKGDVSKGQDYETIEPDFSGFVKAKYSSIAPNFLKKSHTTFFDAGNVNGVGLRPEKPTFEKSDIDIELLNSYIVSRLILNEIVAMQIIQDTALHLKTTMNFVLEKINTLSQSEVAACKRLSKDEVVRANGLVEISLTAEELESSKLVQRKEKIKDVDLQRTFSTLKNQTPTNEKERNKSLVELTDFLTFFPENVPSVLSEIDNHSPDEDYTFYLIGAIAGAKGEGVEKGMRVLMESFRKNAEHYILLERTIRAAQLAPKIPIETVDLLWDLSQDERLSAEVKQVALLTLGTGIHGLLPTEQEPYIDKLHQLFQQANTRMEKMEVLATIGNAGVEKSFDLLKPIVREKDKPIAMQALKSMRLMNAPQVEQLLRETAFDKTMDRNVRYEALHALAHKELSDSTSGELIAFYSGLPKDDASFKIETLRILLEPLNRDRASVRVFLGEFRKRANLLPIEKRLLDEFNVQM